MADVFISYAREDRGRIEPLARAFERNGWTVFWDPVIPPGKTFDAVIEEQLQAAGCVVVVWSADSVRSEWVLAEAAEARDRGVLVPVLVDAVDLPLGFSRVQAADLIGWHPGRSSHGFDVLVDAVADLVKVSSRRTATPAWVLESYRKGRHAFEARDWQQVVDLLEPVIEEDPGYENAASLLANARIQLDQDGSSWVRFLRKRRRPALITASLVVVAGLALVLWPESSPSGSESAQASETSAADRPETTVVEESTTAPTTSAAASTVEVVARVPVGANPIGLAFAGGELWVALRGTGGDGGQLVRVDPSSNAVAGEPVALPATPFALVSGGGYVWASQARDQAPATVSRVDPDADPGSAVRSVPTAPWPLAIAYASDRLWVASRLDGTLTAFNPNSGEQDGDAVEIGVDIVRMAVDHQIIWATSHTDESLVEFDTQTRQVRQIALRSPLEGETAEPFAVAVTSEYVVVTDRMLNRVIVVDRANVLNQRYIEDVGGQPEAAFSLGDRVWVLARRSGELYEIDPASATVVDVQTIGAAPVWGTSGGDSLWISDVGDLNDPADDAVIRVRVDGVGGS